MSISTPGDVYIPHRADIGSPGFVVLNILYAIPPAFPVNYNMFGGLIPKQA
jgi:hypothetical protein